MQDIFELYLKDIQTSEKYETNVNPFGKITLVVDRPFIFFVKEQSTGTILFAGKMGDI